MKEFGRRNVGVMWVLMAEALWAVQANASGALAIGVAVGGAQNGFSYALTSDRATDAIAGEDALTLCKSTKESNAEAHSRCALIGKYSNQCAVIAMDPKDGTPGVGWAIAADSAAAARQALASCEATAGPGRSGTCKVSATRCDGSAAIQDYDQAIKLNPNDTHAFNNRGNAYANKGQYDRAIQDYDQAIKLDPNYAAAFDGRGFAYNAKGQYDRAIQDYDQAIKLNPNDAYAFNGRGVAYNAKGQYDRAIQDYDQAIKLNPNDTYAINNRAAAIAKLNK
jgi:tetratricopeptide (TPR) repeat protein